MLIVAALYHFTPSPTPQALKAPLARIGAMACAARCCWRARGSTAPSPAPRDGIDAVLAISAPCPAAQRWNGRKSTAATMPFGRMKVRLKREIVTMGQPDIDPTAAVGRYVAPRDWNALIQRPGCRGDRHPQRLRGRRSAPSPGPSIPERGLFGDFPNGGRRNAIAFKRASPCSAPAASAARSRQFPSGRRRPEEVFHLKGRHPEIP